MRRLLMALGGLALMVATGTAGACLASPQHAGASPATCPNGDTCVTGKLTVRDPGSDTPNQFLVEDKNGAPMFWVNFGGAWSGGEPVCVTDLHLRPVACLGGPHGSYGGEPSITLYGARGAVTLTAGDIAWIHRAEKVIGRLLYEHR